MIINLVERWNEVSGEPPKTARGPRVFQGADAPCFIPSSEFGVNRSGRCVNAGQHRSSLLELLGTAPNHRPMKRWLSRMIQNLCVPRWFGWLAVWTLLVSVSVQAAEAPVAGVDFPRALASYASAPDASLWQSLSDRMAAEPCNVVASLLFVLAIIHTFLAPTFLKLAHRFAREHEENLNRTGRRASDKPYDDAVEEVSFKAAIFHFLGEIEAIFGIWVIPLLLSLLVAKDWDTTMNYLNQRVSFVEPMFVVVVMTIAASRPILKLAENLMAGVAALGKGTPAAWWFSILTVGPILGSFITEPAAMTISALLLARKIYERRPGPRLAYATIGLLFVNVSVGGTLTHFAAPPVLMVAGTWGWDSMHMFTHFGWKALVGVVVATSLYLYFFRRELRNLGPAETFENQPVMKWEHRPDPVPGWITVAHLMFLGWVVMNNHHPVLFIGGFLFYLAFTQATDHHQNPTQLRPALLVGFFLAGLVVHGGLQGWWIEPVLTRLAEVPLFFGATVLTAFNDNAAITYLASLVPGFSDGMKYAVVAGAVTGGGLTVIANAPNPAGQSILSRFFPEGVAPTKLMLGALFPTGIIILAFLFL